MLEFEVTWGGVLPDDRGEDLGRVQVRQGVGSCDPKLADHGRRDL